MLTQKLEIKCGVRVSVPAAGCGSCAVEIRSRTQEKKEGQRCGFRNPEETVETWIVIKCLTEEHMWRGLYPHFEV